MAEEVQKQAQEEVVVVTDVPQPEKPTPALEKDPPTEEPTKPKPIQEEEPAEVEAEISKSGADSDEKIPQSGSFKEESTRVADLLDAEKKALEELKLLIQDALTKHEFTTLQASPPKEEEQKPAAAEEIPSKVIADDDPPVAAEEPTKAESEASVEMKAEADDEAAEQTTETVVVTAVIEEKVACDAVDDDGAKTVEAIEETIVAVSSSVLQDQPPPPPAKDPEEDQKAASASPLEAEEGDSKADSSAPLPPEEVSIWGIPLLADERSDVILLKFLRARDFKVKDAFTMIKNTVRWRKEFGIDELLEEEELGSDLQKVVFMHGFDKEGHPVCYNVYGEFQNKQLYQKTFSDEEKRQKFLRWRIQFLERSIRKLDLSPGGISTIVQVNDLKNSPGPGKWELRQATKQALQLLQDNYPEFVAKQVFINVPWWYLAVSRMISPFLTQRTKSKFVFAGPSKSAGTLLRLITTEFFISLSSYFIHLSYFYLPFGWLLKCRYIAAEQLPVKYGGLSKDGEFGTTDAVIEITVRPAAKHTVEFPVTEVNFSISLMAGVI